MSSYGFEKQPLNQVVRRAMLACQPYMLLRMHRDDSSFFSFFSPHEDTVWDASSTISALTHSHGVNTSLMMLRSRHSFLPEKWRSCDPAVSLRNAHASPVEETANGVSIHTDFD